MPTLDEQFEQWWEAPNSTAASLDGDDETPAHRGFLAGAAAEREAVLAIATELPRTQIEGCWYIDLDELERRIRQRGEEGK